MSFTDPKMLKVLFDVLTEIPFLHEENFPWAINGKLAQGGYGQRFWQTGLLQPTNLLEIINTLKEEHGWKRGSRHADDGPAWILFAYIERDGYRVEISGSRLYDEGRPDGVDNTAISFFAPSYPAPPKRWVPEGPKAKKWIADCNAIDEKTANDEW